jgi:uncharacterized protein
MTTKREVMRKEFWKKSAGKTGAWHTASCKAASWKTVVPIVLVALALASCGDDDGGAKKIAVDPQYQSEINLWRIQRQEAATNPDGLLTPIGLFWVTQRAHFIGNSARSGMRIPNGPPSLGMLQQSGDRLFFRPESNVPITVNGEPASGRVELQDDLYGAPTLVGFDEGKGQLRLVRTSGRVAIQVKHADAAARAGFKGLDFWPIDPAWKVQATFVPHPADKTLEVVAVTGMTELVRNPGYVQFQRGESAYKLDVLDVGGPDWLLIFADLTSGHDSYGQGRYIDLQRVASQGPIAIDFNRAYNPPAAFNSYTTAILAPRDNRVDFAVTAGEKRYGGKPGAQPSP